MLHFQAFMWKQTRKSHLHSIVHFCFTLLMNRHQSINMISSLRWTSLGCIHGLCTFFTYLSHCHQWVFLKWGLKDQWGNSLILDCWFKYRPSVSLKFCCVLIVMGGKMISHKCIYKLLQKECAQIKDDTAAQCSEDPWIIKVRTQTSRCCHVLHSSTSILVLSSSKTNTKNLLLLFMLVWSWADTWALVSVFIKKSGDGINPIHGRHRPSRSPLHHGEKDKLRGSTTCVPAAGAQRMHPKQRPAPPLFPESSGSEITQWTGIYCIRISSPAFPTWSQLVLVVTAAFYLSYVLLSAFSPKPFCLEGFTRRHLSLSAPWGGCLRDTMFWFYV